MAPGKGLLERLHSGDGVIIGEGYLFELEARGYLKAGSYVPEVVLTNPNIVQDLHREFVHAGSDVVLALTYYGHREKLRLIGREDDLERLNRKALKIARKVADETETLMAGNICNTNIYSINNPTRDQEIYRMFSEQVHWAVTEAADFIVGETFHSFGEAKLALKAIKEHGKGCPCVMTLAIADNMTFDGLHFVEACKLLKEDGADVIGLNCSQGPQTMLPMLKELCNNIQGPIAGVPVAYRTNEKDSAFYCLNDIDEPETSAFPYDLGPYMCSRRQIGKFSREAWDIGVRYLGICCGNRAHYLRTMAEAVGRTPPASRFSMDMTEHAFNIQNERYQLMQESVRKHSSQYH